MNLYLFLMDYGDEGDWLIRSADSDGDAVAQIPADLIQRAKRVIGFRVTPSWQWVVKQTAIEES